MQIIGEIFRDKNLGKEGKILIREAVRAVILDKSDRLLMVFSSQGGDFKFPGGGVERGESHFQALSREVEEECGLIVEKTFGDLGMVIEYKKAREKAFDIFQMNSFYYIYTLQKKMKKQNLDQYEKDLGLKPVWIRVQKAFEANRAVLDKERGFPDSWVERETLVLNTLLEQMDRGVLLPRSR